MSLSFEQRQLLAGDYAAALHEKETQRSLGAQIEVACSRVAPLWPLKNFVAVNPFVGLADQTFPAACNLLRRVTHGALEMPLEYYAGLYHDGQIQDSDLLFALHYAKTAHTQARGSDTCSTSTGGAKANHHFSLEDLKNALHLSVPPPSARYVNTVADVLDQTQGTQWAAFIVDEISKWCSAYYDEAQTSWRMPWRGQPLFEAWKAAAHHDLNPEVMGLKGFRQFLKRLPDDVGGAIGYSLQALGVGPQGATDFLHRQLMSVAGWSGYVQYQAREKALHGQQDDSLQHLLAIRLIFDAALFRHHGGTQFRAHWAEELNTLQKKEGDNDPPHISVNYLWQIAAEHAYQNQLIGRISSDAQRTSKTSQSMTQRDGIPNPLLQKPTIQKIVVERPAVQAIFCIDVRSEVLRRALEAQSQEIETIGFAGFFGFPIEFVPFGMRHGQAQCPVLITPKFRIRESVAGASREEVESALHQEYFLRRVARGWNSFKTSAVSCFAFVETGGLWAGGKLIKDSLGLSHKNRIAQKFAPDVHHNHVHHDQHQSTKREGHPHSHLHGTGMKPDEQIAVAANALKHMGLTQNLARLVVICGHGSRTTNNPYGAGLDCGACGGHSGEANARVAAAVLNHPPTREGLKAHGIEIPDDTHFLAALHNTTTDEVTLFDEHLVPAFHAKEVQSLKRWLGAASQQTRIERAPRLGVRTRDTAQIEREVDMRSRNWAETRPEWGLAGNAAFIAAPRERTKGLDLSGRAFLNNYDFTSDADGSKLELIMTAPLVVASWINLQYFASTVNNRHFGSGNKTIHNVVGALGVWQGNCGDLQVGLPLQSVHDGANWMHEPLRLSAFIEAPRHMINTVIEKHVQVRELLDNRWLHLIAIEDRGNTFARYCGDMHWQEENLGKGGEETVWL